MNAVRSAFAVGLLLTVTLAGCAGTAAPSPQPSSPPPTDAPPTQVPGGISQPPAGNGVDPGTGGGSDPGNPGQANVVVPRPGTIDPHPVAIDSLEAQVEGRKVVIVATWTSGVEPCYVLDTVALKQDGTDFTVRLTEGAGQADAICIEIAQQKSTAIDLGELAPGEYTVTAQDGTAPTIVFTVA